MAAWNQRRRGAYTPEGNLANDNIQHMEPDTRRREPDEDGARAEVRGNPREFTGPQERRKSSTRGLNALIQRAILRADSGQGSEKTQARLKGTAFEGMSKHSLSPEQRSRVSGGGSSAGRYGELSPQEVQGFRAKGVLSQGREALDPQDAGYRTPQEAMGRSQTITEAESLTEALKRARARMQG
jgi:hypothetical protein